MAKSEVIEFIKSEEKAYETTPIPLASGWDWSMPEHIRRSFLYLNSKFAEGDNDDDRPYNQIIEPILSVAYRTEGFDVKDIDVYVNDADNYYKSFLVRKFHAVWARKFDLDTFIDETVEGYTDYGLALSKNVNAERPENIPLQSIAFCDQTDVLAGAIGLKFNLSPTRVREMAQEGGWDMEQVELAIKLSKEKKEVSQADGQTARLPSKSIEVYEVHGVFDATWLTDEESPLDEEDREYVQQMHIVAMYMGKDNKREGLCLFSGKEKPEGIFKAVVRKPIFGRACGRGGVEELFAPQMWINYSEARQKDMLDTAALLILQSADPTFASRNNISDLESGEVLTHAEGKPVTQVAISANNQQHFTNKVAEWEERAKKIGSASDSALAQNPKSGTPFALEQLITQEGKGIHEYRQGKIAIYIGEIYRDWVLEHFVREINKGQEFFEELSMEELEEIQDAVVTNQLNKRIVKQMLDSEAKAMTTEEHDMLKEVILEEFMSGGGKKFLKILKDDIKDIPVDVYISIVGKQKDLAGNAEKLTNIFRQIAQAPAILEIPGMSSLFNEILEASGLSPINFTGLSKKKAGGQGEESELDNILQTQQSQLA